MRETKDILIAWKNTRVLKRMGTEYPSKSAGIEGAPRDFDYRQYLTEDECKAVDDALFALKEDNYNAWVILTAVYQRGFTRNKLGDVLGIGQNEAYRLFAEASIFIRGHIYPFFNKKVA